MESLIKTLSSDDVESYAKALQNYNKTITEGLHGELTVKQRLTAIIIEKLHQSKHFVFCAEALTLLRYMSRDRDVVLKYMGNSSFLNLLIKYGKLSKFNAGNEVVEDVQSELNACKCLSNVIYLTRDSQGLCNNSDFMKSIVRKIGCYEARSHEQNVAVLRLIFLASALSSQGRKKLVGDFDARKVIIDFLKYVLLLNQEGTSADTDARPISELSTETTNMLNEILKVIFNLNMDLRRSSMYSQQEQSEMEDIVELCRLILMSKSTDACMTEGLHCNAGNAMYSVPPACFKISKLIQTSPNICLDPVMVLLEILRNRIMNNNITTDILHPLLALLSHVCRLSRDIRIFFKNEILPPRKDFKHRPEEGEQLRHKLIKLFTHNNTDVKHGVADFLFVLCKESVDRFVKYTGYGNAAGLLAARGLLAGGEGETVYSDTDSESDTEEYKEVCEDINPVTGHVPQKHVNPMEGMTEEQKEYLAAQLANEISKLSSGDIIQPMCVGDDGQLIPLRQKVHETKLEESEEDSDDD